MIYLVYYVGYYGQRLLIAFNNHNSAKKWVKENTNMNSPGYNYYDSDKIVIRAVKLHKKYTTK